MHLSNRPLLTRRRLLGALGAGLFVPAAPRILRAQGLGLGLGIDITRKGGSGSSYTAQAVHFDGATGLTKAVLSCTDGAAGIISVWAKISSDPITGGEECLFVGGSGGQNGMFSFTDTTNFQWLFIGTEQIGDVDQVPLPATWEHWLGACNFGGSTPSLVLYQTGVSVGQPPDAAGGAPAFNLNGQPFYIGTDATNEFLTGDLADFQLWTNTSILESDGTISPAHLALFVSGGAPVNPAVAAAALGSPVVKFSGNAATWTSQAAAQGFTITGTLTNASTHP